MATSIEKKALKASDPDVEVAKKEGQVSGLKTHRAVKCLACGELFWLLLKEVLSGAYTPICDSCASKPYTSHEPRQVPPMQILPVSCGGLEDLRRFLEWHAAQEIDDLKRPVPGIPINIHFAVTIDASPPKPQEYTVRGVGSPARSFETSGTLQVLGPVDKMDAYQEAMALAQAQAAVPPVVQDPTAWFDGATKFPVEPDEAATVPDPSE